MRLHNSAEAADSNELRGPLTRYASLVNKPVRFNLESQIASLVVDRMKIAAPKNVRLAAAKIVPAFTTQSFTLSNGSLRYYVRAEWRSGNEPRDPATYVLAAWIAPGPKPHVLAIQRETSPYGFEEELPNLRNVVDLGNGRTGLIITSVGEESVALFLVEYRDGADLTQMRTLQSISPGE